jgi:hypothetical protein
VKFEHAKPNSALDKAGADFVVEFLTYGLAELLQVKTSDNGETLAVLLPLPNFFIEELPNRISEEIFESVLPKLPRRLQKKISRQMLQRLTDHCRKHQNVQWVLFVARVSQRKDESQIKNEIWRETKFIFKILKHRAEKTRKKQK